MPLALAGARRDGMPVQWLLLLTSVADPSSGGLDFEAFAAVFRQQMQVPASEFTDSDMRKLWSAALSSKGVAPAARAAPASLVADYMDSLRLAERSPDVRLDRSASTQQWLAASPLVTAPVESPIPIERPTPDSRREHHGAVLEPESEVAHVPGGEEATEQRIRQFAQGMRQKHDEELTREKARAGAASANDLERQQTKFQVELTAKYRQEIEGLIAENTSLGSQLRVLESQVEPLRQAERSATDRWRMREQEIAALRAEQRESEQIEEASAQTITELTHELRGARGEVILYQARADEYKEQLENEQRRVFGDDEMRRATQELDTKAQLLKRCHRMLLQIQVFAAWRDAMQKFKTVQWKYRAVQYGLRARNAATRGISEGQVAEAAMDAGLQETDAHTHAELSQLTAELTISQSEVFKLRDRSERVAQNVLHTREMCLKRMVYRKQVSLIARTFDRWVELYDENARLKLLGARVVCRMRALALATALTQWKGFAWQQTNRKRAINRMSQRRTHAIVKQCWNRWITYTGQSKQSKELDRVRKDAAINAPTRAQNIKQLDNLAAMGLRRMLASSMATCFTIWRERTCGLVQLSKLRHEAAERLMAVTAQTGAQNIEQLDNLAAMGLRRMLASSMATCFTIWREHTCGLIQVSRLRSEHEEALADYRRREGKLQQDCAVANSAAKTAVLRMLNAASSLSNPSASKLVRLRLSAGASAESKLVAELVHLLQVPTARMRIACVQYEPELEVDTDTRPATIDVEILPAVSKSPGPSSEKLVVRLAEAIGLGTHSLFAEGLALPMIDREHGVGTIDRNTGEVHFEHSAFSTLVRLQAQFRQEQLLCATTQLRHQETSTALERHIAELDAKRLEIERMQEVLTAKGEATETLQDTLAATRTVIDRARAHLSRRSTRTRDVMCLRGAFSKWVVESRETFRCESTWLRGQLVSLESDLEKETRIVEGLKGSLKMAKEVADTSRAAHQAQLGRVKEREAKKGMRVEAALLREWELGRRLRKTFRAWVAQRMLSWRHAEYLKTLRVAFRAWVFSLGYVKLVEQLYQSTAAIEALQGVAGVINNVHVIEYGDE